MSGQLVFKFDGATHTIGPNQFIIISSSVVHDVTNGPNRAFVLQIPLAFIEKYYSKPEQLNFVTRDLKSTNYKKIVDLFSELDYVNKYKKSGYLFDFGIILLIMLKNLILNFSEDKKNIGRVTSDLKDIIIFINDHYAEELSVQNLAYKYGYNASYLSRLFKKQTGITLIQYVYKIRLNNLYQDLINSDISINNLMKKHGLTNQRTARIMFKEMFGELPNQVRTKYKMNVRLK
ncbi:AraC family transcriptional regulator [Paucilactobacillus hokkaidonensis]|nr:AraC family transcriptional regulator [Paucilactobacillus hokkaidonensis]